MSLRQVVLLGTGSQVPSRARSHNALFLFWDELGILFDPGEGTQRQMILAGIAATQITHVAITHFHGDHCLGLPGTVQRLSLDRVPHPVEVVYPASGQVYFERLRHASVFHDQSRIVPRPIACPPGEEVVLGPWPTSTGGVRLHARPLDHVVDCYGYRVQEEDGVRMRPDLLAAAGVAGPDVSRLQRLGAIELGGRRIALEAVSEPRPGQAAALVMDTRPCAGALALARGVDLLVCEATFRASESEEARGYAHMTAGQAGELARDAGARRLVLTHFSQRYTSLAEHGDEARAFHGDVVVGEDLLRAAVPARAGQRGAPPDIVAGAPADAAQP